MEQTEPASATEFNANKSDGKCICGRRIDNQDAPTSKQDVPLVPQKTTGKCTCGKRLPTVPQTQTLSRLEDQYPVSEASLPQKSIKEEYPIRETFMNQIPQSTTGQCQCGRKLEDDSPISDAPISEAPISEAPISEAPISEAPMPHVAKCTCGRSNATPNQFSPSKVEVEESPPIMPQEVQEPHTPHTCTCRRPIAAPQAAPNAFMFIKQEVQDDALTEQLQLSTQPTHNCLCQKQNSNTASQQSAQRVQSQSPSRTDRSCSCGQKLKREVPQSPSRAVQCPCKKHSQQQTQVPPNESIFKSLQTIGGFSDADFVPRSGQKIPLIPMNLNYPLALGKCSCGGDITEYSSRALTPATFLTETSASTNPPTSTIPTRVPEEEYYSLSSSEKDDVTCTCPVVTQNSSIYKTPESMESPPVERGRSEGRSHLLKREKRARSESAARNVIILQLLHEVVHLINEDESVSDSTSSTPAKQKIRNIGTCFNDDCHPDVGAFSSRTNLSSIKITFMPSGGDACPRQCIDASDSQQNVMNMMPQPQSFEMNCPTAGSQCCNVFISPNLNKYPSCPLGGGHPGLVGNFAHVGIEAQSFVNWNPGSETINYAMEELQNHTNIVCEPDIIMDEYGNPIICTSTTNPAVCSPNNDETAEECPPDCTCPIHDSPMGDGTETCIDDEQMPIGTSMMRPSVLMKLKQLTATPVEVRTEVAPLYAFASEANCDEEDYEGDYEDDNYQYEMERRTERKNQSDCDCCHCRAMREVNDPHNMPCKAIAPHQQALGNGNNCNELKYFIDSIIMDLDAMEHARRNKMNQKLNPKKNAICGRESFPVTITDVTELGSSSLYVKWCIHDCYGIGGYEIYVDGHLTNRYFHCNHEAAVICDVSVTDPHKIVLLAQPKVNDSYEEICSVQKENKSDINKSLAAKKNGKSDLSQINRNGKDPNAVWTPSIYYYDPVVSKSAPIKPMCSGVK